jgi:hypothetical protein
MNKDDKVRDILARFGEDMSSTWMVQGTRVILHQAVERIAAKAGVIFEEPTILRAERDEAVILVRGRLGDRWDYDIGEALVNVNYRVSGKQAGYVWAMALKRGRDRLVLKLIGVHGLLYSEEEADEFQGGQPAQETPPQEKPAKEARHSVMDSAITSGKPIQLDDGEVHPSEALKRKIDEHRTPLGIQTLMLKFEVQEYLSSIPEEHKNELRDYAKSRMVDLGWGKNNAR